MSPHSLFLYMFNKEVLNKYIKMLKSKKYERTFMLWISFSILPYVSEIFFNGTADWPSIWKNTNIDPLSHTIHKNTILMLRDLNIRNKECEHTSHRREITVCFLIIMKICSMSLEPRISKLNKLWFYL